MDKPACAVTPLLFEAQEAALSPLDRLPRSLWLGGMTHAGCELATRLAALEEWRGALDQLAALAVAG